MYDIRGVPWKFVRDCKGISRLLLTLSTLEHLTFTGCHVHRMRYTRCPVEIRQIVKGFRDYLWRVYRKRNMLLVIQNSSLSVINALEHSTFIGCTIHRVSRGNSSKIVKGFRDYFWRYQCSSTSTGCHVHRIRYTGCSVEIGHSRL